MEGVGDRMIHKFVRGQREAWRCVSMCCPGSWAAGIRVHSTTSSLCDPGQVT